MQENRESPRYQGQGGYYKFQIGVANRIFLKPFWPLGLDGLMAVGLYGLMVCGLEGSMV